MLELPVWFARAHTPFSERTYCQASGLELLQQAFPWGRVGTPQPGEEGVLLYDDTPLVTPEALGLVCARLRESGGGRADVGKGYVQLGNSQNRFQIHEFWATEVENESDYRNAVSVIKARVEARLRAIGVLLPDPSSVTLGYWVRGEEGACVHPHCVLGGHTYLGRGAVIYPFCDLTDVQVGARAQVRSTYAEGGVIGPDSTVGPFACLRRGTRIGAGCRVGDYVEIKNSVLGEGTKAAHLAYVGDAEVGAGTNIGCGAVFANYNGKIKQRVQVGEGVFIGCNANLVAPLQVGDGAYIAAGSTVTDDVPAGTLCIARARQVHKPKKNR